MKYITASMLKRLNACEEQADLFDQVFGDRAEITATNIDRARKAGLMVYWLVFNLRDKGYLTYAQVIDYELERAQVLSKVDGELMDAWRNFQRGEITKSEHDMLVLSCKDEQDIGIAQALYKLLTHTRNPK